MGSPNLVPSDKTFDDITTQVIVLSFDLIAQQTAKLPSLLEKSFNDPAVKKGIQDALDAFVLKKMMGTGMNNLTAKDASDLVNGLAKSAGGKLEDAALKQIKASADYKRLETTIAEFERVAKATPFGVWIDRHAGVVYVTGVALVIGGAAVLFATKTESKVTKLVVGQLKNKPFQIFKVGNFKMQGQVLAFQPDKRIVGAGLVAIQKWHKLEVTASLGVIMASTTVQQINGSVVLKTGDINVGVTATDMLAKKTINLGLTIGFENSPLKPLKIGAGAVITGEKVTGGTFSAGLETQNSGNFALNVQPIGKEHSALATWTVHF